MKKKVLDKIRATTGAKAIKRMSDLDRFENHGI